MIECIEFIWHACVAFWGVAVYLKLCEIRIALGGRR